MPRKPSPGILLKERVHRLLVAQLEQKISGLQHFIDGSDEYRVADFKRRVQLTTEPYPELMEMEVKKAVWQLAHRRQMLDQLQSVNPLVRSRTAEFGSLLITTFGLYFLGIPAGPIEVDDIVIYGVEMEAPMGKLVSGHRRDAILQFEGRDCRIWEIF